MFPVHDALDAILIGCFLFGIIFTLASLLLGFADVGLHDLGLHGAGGHDLGVHGHDIGHGHDTGVHHDSPLAYFNISTILAFITWFGGVGYLVRNGFGWVGWLSVIVGLAGGFVGALAIGWVVFHVLIGADHELDPREYEVRGTLARVTSSIRPGGYGEIVYEMGGTRQVSGARAVGGEGITRGTEVVVMKVERGVAIVEPWDNLIGDDDLRSKTIPDTEP